MRSGPLPYWHRDGEGDARWWLGALATFKATGKDTDGQYVLIDLTEPQYAEAPLHVHHDEDEAFWVLEGEVAFQAGDETIATGPDSFLFVPRGKPHGYTVERGPARLLLLVSPSRGFEDFVYATSEPAEAPELPPAPDGPPTAEEIRELGDIALRYGTEFLT